MEVSEGRISSRVHWVLLLHLEVPPKNPTQSALGAAAALGGSPKKPNAVFIACRLVL